MPIYRYPGINPFSSNEQNVYFGRDEDIENLYTSVILNQCTVMTGKSGIGKTSLIYAGLLPKIEKEINNNEREKRQIVTLPIRIGIWTKDDPVSLMDKLKQTLVAETSDDGFMKFLPNHHKESLWFKLKEMQFASRTDSRKKIYLLLFDQLEELFTYPYEQFKELVKELKEIISTNLPDPIRKVVSEVEKKKMNLISDVESEILDAPPPVKFLFAIRSDKLTLLIRMKEAVTNIFQNPYELRPLSMKQAFDAVKKPASAPGEFETEPFEIKDETVYGICEYLWNQPNSDLDSNFEDIRIEPFTLQIICQHIERNLLSRDDDRVIEEHELPDPNDIIKDYYQDVLLGLNLPPHTLESVRVMIEEKMIYEQDQRRLILYKEIVLRECGIGEDVLNKLVKSRLLRELTASGTKSSYEISHDWLVIPILNAKNERVRNIGTEKVERFDASINALEKELERNPNDYTVHKKLGDYYAFLQDYSYAIYYYGEAIKKKAELGVMGGDFELYFSRGDCYFKSQNYSVAIEDMLYALELQPDHLSANFSLAFCYQMTKQLEKAEPYYKKVIMIDPKYSTAYYNLGLIYRTTKRPDESRESFLTTLELNPNDHEAYYSLGLLASDQDQFEEALAYYDKCLELAPTYVDAYLQKAVVYSLTKQHDEAAQALNKAVAVKPDYISGYKGLGHVHHTLKNYREAEKNFYKVVTLDHKDFEPYYYLGVLANDQSKFKDAIFYFNKCLEINPSLINALIEKAYACRQMQLIAQARECYEQVLQLDPANEKAKTQLEVLNQYSENEKTLMKQVEADPSDVEAWYDLGVYANNKQSFSEAIRYFTNVLNLKPDYINALIEKAYAHSGLNEIDNGIDCYKTIIGYDPDNHLANRSLARIYHSQQNYELAQQYFSAAIRIQPEDHDSMFALVQIFNDLKVYQKAIEYSNKLLQIKPDHLDGLMEQAYAYAMLGEVDKAFECYNKILQFDPGNYKAYRRIGVLLSHSGQYAQADASFEKAIQVNPDDFETFYEWGISANAEKKYPKAIKCFEKSVEINPQFAKAYGYLAKYYYEVKDFEKSRNFYTRVTELEPENTTSIYNLGLVYQRLGDYKNAAIYFLKALELNNDDYEAAYYAGECFEYVNDIDSAVECYQYAQKIKPDSVDVKLKLQKLVPQPAISNNSTNSSSL